MLHVIGDLAKEKRTMILVTHEMKFARQVASHVVFLHEGKIAERGHARGMLWRARNPNG